MNVNKVCAVYTIELPVARRATFPIAMCSLRDVFSSTDGPVEVDLTLNFPIEQLLF